MADSAPVKPTTGMLLCGVMSSEVLDSSGEIVSIRGMDITTLERGEGVLNYEHRGDEGNGQEVVGRIVYAHKVLKEEDCEDDRQRAAWKKLHVPFLWGVMRLYDGAGHPGAVALAAAIRDQKANDEKILLRLSIEGSTLARDKQNPNRIVESIARKCAATWKPCNRTCDTDLLADPNAPAGFPKLGKGETHIPPDAYPLGGGGEIGAEELDAGDPAGRLLAAAVVMRLLAKATTAGAPDAPPSTLTGGAALQREDVETRARAKAALRDYGWDRPFRKGDFITFAKARLPEVSPDFLNHFADIAEGYAIRKAGRGWGDPALAGLRKAEAALGDLRQDLRRLLDPVGPLRPRVYALNQRRPDGTSRPLGRYLVTPEGSVHHLEDYHRILEQHLPEGPLDPHAVARLHGTGLGADFQVAEHRLPGEEAPAPPPDPGSGGEVEVAEAPEPTPAPIFRYRRPGWLRAHTLEFGPHGAALDGQTLTPDELGLIVQNVQSGLASLKYPDPPADPEEGMAKTEMTTEDALNHVRRVLGENHEAVRALARDIYEDRMVPGVGNKYAYTQFRQKGQPGVYVSMDANSFKHVNDTYGHDTGDQAIQAVGHALRQASDKVGMGKLFRPGGDEFVAHFPTYEHAATFARHAVSHLDAIPPIQGQHKLSVSMGFGSDFPSADRALYHAKDQKKDPVTGRAAFPPGSTPHLAHSLVGGAEGPVPLHHATPPAAHLPAAPAAPHAPKPAA